MSFYLEVAVGTSMQDSSIRCLSVCILMQQISVEEHNNDLQGLEDFLTYNQI